MKPIFGKVVQWLACSTCIWISVLETIISPNNRRVPGHIKITIFTIFGHTFYIITENKSKTSIYMYFMNRYIILNLIYIINKHISYYKH